MGRRPTAARVENLHRQTGGFLALEPAFVARDWIPAGRRFALPDGHDYDVEGRGALCERRLASTTRADNTNGPH